MLKLNLARNCLKYIIRAYGIKEIFIPYYSCETIWQAIRQENCKIHFYHIDKNMMPASELPQNSYILYINYYGLCGKKSAELAQKYPNLIVDNTQAFYSRPIGLASFNSLRKFFKVQNGAYLWCDKQINKSIKEDDLYLPPVLMSENYDLFVKNELILDKETEIKNISHLVNESVKKINYEKDKIMRRNLYKNYESVLGKYNSLNLELDEESVPYCYPFSTKDTEFLEKLDNGNFVLLKLWEKCNEPVYEDVIAFPLQDETYAKKIIEYCLNC